MSTGISTINQIPSPYFQQTSREQRQSDFSVTTSEGDKITFSANAQWYTDTTLTDQNFTAFSLRETGLSLSVQGNLNSDELNDLHALFRDLQQIGNAFYNGDMNQALSDASAMGSYQSIKGFEATFQRHTSAVLSTAHPLPVGLPDNMPFAPDDHQPQSYADQLLADWRQLEKYLTQNHLPAPKEQTIADIDALLQEMQQRLTETIIKHPKHSPLALPIAEKALNSIEIPPEFITQARTINNGVMQALNKWLIGAEETA